MQRLGGEGLGCSSPYLLPLLYQDRQWLLKKRGEAPFCPPLPRSSVGTEGSSLSGAGVSAPPPRPCRGLHSSDRGSRPTLCTASKEQDACLLLEASLYISFPCLPYSQEGPPAPPDFSSPGIPL